jgi:hypothetical protein
MASTAEAVAAGVMSPEGVLVLAASLLAEAGAMLAAETGASDIGGFLPQQVAIFTE